MTVGALIIAALIGLSIWMAPEARRATWRTWGRQAGSLLLRVGGVLLALYLVIRFVKWAWTD